MYVYIYIYMRTESVSMDVLFLIFFLEKSGSSRPGLT